MDVLKKKFSSVFTLAPQMADSESSKRDPMYHCAAKANQRGAVSLIELMNQPEHKTKKIQTIVFEYIRCSGEYYTNMVMGGKSGNEGNTVIQFIRQLKDYDKLGPNCVMILACCTDERWSRAMTNYTEAFGDCSRIGNMDNPLFEACEEAKNVNCSNHEANLKHLTRQMETPFIRFNVNREFPCQDGIEIESSDDGKPANNNSSDSDFELEPEPDKKRKKPNKKKKKRKKHGRKKEKKKKKKESKKNDNKKGKQEGTDIHPTPSHPASLADAFLVIPEEHDEDKRVDPGKTSGALTARTRFLSSEFNSYEELNKSRQLLGLNVSQSNKDKSRIRYRDKTGPKIGHLMTFRYNRKSGRYHRAKGSGARKLEDILQAWEKTSPTAAGKEGKEKYEAYSGRRRTNVVWTNAAANLVLDMVDTTKHSKRYTATQIAEILNRPETEGVYKHPRDRDRVFTAGRLGLRGLWRPPGFRHRLVRVEGSLGPTWVCQVVLLTR